MEVAVMRVDPEERGNEPFLADQRLDLLTAVEAFRDGRDDDGSRPGRLRAFAVGPTRGVCR
jgi:hypothetical protein